MREIIILLSMQGFLSSFAIGVKSLMVTTGP